MKKVLSFFILFISFVTSVSSDTPSMKLLPYDFKVDGLCYKIKSDGNSVKVTYKNFLLLGGSKNIDLKGKIVIPERVEYDGKSYLVTEIGGSAFYGCSGLTSITIPNSVTVIGSLAFADCTGLSSVTIPKSVTSIGEKAFKGTAWYDNQPDGLIYLGKVAYKYKGEMPDGTSIVLKDGCSAISSYAFSSCTGLTSVTIPNSVTEIGSTAFSGCTGLTSVEIPDSVTNIDSYAFSGCIGLTSVSIPNSVTVIGNSAFEGCTRLDSVVSRIIEPQFVVLGEKGNNAAAASVFNGVDLHHCILRVTKGTKNLYDHTFPWYTFDNISEDADSVPFNNPITDGQNLQRYYESRQYTNVIELGEQLLQNPDFASNSDNVNVLIQIAESYYYMHRYNKAKNCFEIALRLYETSNVENRLKIAEMHENIGNCYFNLNEYDNAIESFIYASNIYESDDKVAYIQEMIGQCYLSKNEFDKAKDYYTKAINSYKKYNKFIGGFRCHIAIEQFNEAKEWLYDISEREKEPMIIATFFSYLIVLDLKPLIQKRYEYYYDNQMYDEAIDLCTQAQEMTAGPSQTSQMSIYSLYSRYSRTDLGLSEMKGRCYYAKNDIDSALIVFQAAKKSMSHSKIMPFFSLFNRPNRDLQSQLDEDIALCYISKDDYASAYSYIKESVELRQESTLDYFGLNTTAERAEYWGSQSYLFQNTYPAVAFEIYNPKDTTQGQREMLCDLYEKSALFSKGLLLTSENEFKNIILDSPNENVKRMFYRLQDINIELNKLQEQLSPEQEDIILQLEQEAKNIESELLSISKEYRDFRGNMKITWDSVQTKVGDNDIAIEFLSFPKLGTDEVQYIAMTVRPGYTHPHMTVLCDESELLAAARQPYTSTALSDSIWGKLYRAGELEGVKNIYFSPCGELHKIGIESMPHWSKSGVMMTDSVEGFNIYRLSSTRELALNRTPIESTGAAVFGGIYYKGDTTKLGARYKGHEGLYAFNSPRSITRGFDFSDVDLRGISSTDFLSASLDEVKSIKALFENRKDSVYYKTEFDATETSFKELEGQKMRVIHIATHGFFLTDSAVRAEKQKGNIQFLTDDAMTHSGLLFSAAAITVQYHEKVSESYEDGVLTAYEVSHLNLRGLDLVVLSACQTGNGEISGEGVFGMQRGFKMAGAQSIIMSLWDVNDEATKDMMTKFYSYWLEGDGMSKRKAFLKAQQDVRNNDYQDNKYSYSYVDKDNNTVICTSTSQEHEKRRKYEELRNTRPHWAAFILLDAM